MRRREVETMDEVRFTIPGKPFGKQRPRVVNRGKFSSAYTPKETVQYENLVKLYFQQAAHGEMFPDDAMLDVGKGDTTSQTSRF